MTRSLESSTPAAPPPIVSPSVPARALGAVAAALLSVGCRTPSVAARPEPAAAPAESAAETVYIASAPLVFVTPGEQAFLLLDATLMQEAEGAASLELGYLASSEPAGGSAEEAARVAARGAVVLLDAFTPILPEGVRAAVATAVFGRPGSWGLGVPVRLSRDDGRWSPVSTGAARRVLVPPLPDRVDRRASSEREAVLAARAFLERLDEEDYDGAWELASAVVKATTSRSAFEGELREGSRAPQPGERRECFRRYAVRAGGLATGDVVDVCFASERGVIGVQVRLDDDQQWRVGHLTRFGPEERRVVSKVEGRAQTSLPREEGAKMKAR